MYCTFITNFTLSSRFAKLQSRLKNEIVVVSITRRTETLVTMFHLRYLNLIFLVVLVIPKSQAFISPVNKVNNGYYMNRSFSISKTSSFSSGMIAIQKKSEKISQRKISHTPELNMSILSGACNAYNYALRSFPLSTNSVTSAVLCGCGDVIAQVKHFRSQTKEDNSSSWRTTFKSIDRKRLSRYAAKGLISGVIWSMYYTASELILQRLESGILFATFANLSTAGTTYLRTAILLLLEQVLGCPIIYGLWDLPIATVMNGAPKRRIPHEIRTKLGEMLKENAKLWTFANIIVYNVPVHLRTGVSSIFDIWWESIVSELSAHCKIDNVEASETLIPVEYVEVENVPVAAF